MDALFDSCQLIDQNMDVHKDTVHYQVKHILNIASNAQEEPITLPVLGHYKKTANQRVCVTVTI